MRHTRSALCRSCISYRRLLYFTVSVRSAGPLPLGRHMPEIEQGLVEANGGKPVAFSFTPHLLPMTRGVPRCRTPAWANAYRPC